MDKYGREAGVITIERKWLSSYWIMAFSIIFRPNQWGLWCEKRKGNTKKLTCHNWWRWCVQMDPGSKSSSQKLILILFSFPATVLLKWNLDIPLYNFVPIAWIRFFTERDFWAWIRLGRSQIFIQSWNLSDSSLVASSVRMLNLSNWLVSAFIYFIDPNLDEKLWQSSPYILAVSPQTQIIGFWNHHLGALNPT